jgi:hypothetical protein
VGFDIEIEYDDIATPEDSEAHWNALTIFLYHFIAVISVLPRRPLFL